MTNIEIRNKGKCIDSYSTVSERYELVELEGTYYTFKIINCKYELIKEGRDRERSLSIFNLLKSK